MKANVSRYHVPWGRMQKEIALFIDECWISEEIAGNKAPTEVDLISVRQLHEEGINLATTIFNLLPTYTLLAFEIRFKELMDEIRESKAYKESL